MSSDERLAVKDVVMDKISGVEENVPPEPERYKCDHCPISFTMLDISRNIWKESTKFSKLKMGCGLSIETD